MYSTPPDLLAGFKGILLLRGGKVREDGRGRGGYRKRRRGQGREKGEGGREGGAWGGGRRMDRGDKYPTWSSQDLGSTG